MTFNISGRSMGSWQPVYVIAEVSANHNQDLDAAIELVRAAKAAGADAVKVQTYTPDTITLRSDRAPFQIGGGTLWDGRVLWDLYQDAYMPWEWQPRLKEEAERLGLHFFSTPFDFSAVDFLEELGVPAYKIASFELVDLPLIRRVARTGKPLILSTGMATVSEIEEAITAAREAGAEQIALLRTNSSYPAPPDEMDLRTIPHMAELFGVPVGLSDHTLGAAVPVAAAAMGAALIEKHFALSRSVRGPDSAFSLEPDEFKAMVDAVRTAEKALGGIRYGPTEKEGASRVFRRSLFVVQDVRAGEPFTEENVRSIRPAHGLHPRYYDEILGRRAKKDIEAGTPLSWDIIR